MDSVNNEAFFAAVLKAVACTRNHGTDQAEYATGVQAPAAEVRKLEKELGEEPLTRADAEHVIGLLELTFRTKRTPDEEREHYLRHIEEVSGFTRRPADAFAR